MALDLPTIEKLSRILGRKIFVEPNVIASLDFTQLQAAISAIDNAMNSTTNQAASAFPNTAIKTALLSFIQNAVPGISTTHAGIALMLWTAETVGLTDILGGQI